ncbi:MAG: ABC-F family ATP-binding cassette domain-containing protein, partial [Calditrichaeota bacterium]|nr:ABC-F family ATP-binding cassette domain-containing protein [Calditrichota bacterium]
MLQFQQISLGFSGKLLLNDVSFQFPSGKTALVGPNGIGKSSLFRLISGQVSPQRGSVVKSANLNIAHLEQDLTINSDENLLDFALKAFSDLYLLEKKLHEKQRQLASAKQSEFEQISKEIEKLNHEFETRNGYTIEADAKKILSGLGFSSSDFEKSLSSFSGGWRIRAFLAQLLLQNPDFLLLDEPTNHLDLEALLWLENYLKTFSKSLLIISHDKWFLDQIVNQTIEIEHSSLQLYKGNVSAFENLKEERLALIERQNSAAQSQIDHIQRFVDRFRSKATKAKQVQSRIKLLEKLKLNQIIDTKKAIHFNFQVKEQSSKIVFDCKSLCKSYDHPILNSVSTTIYRGDKIAILGTNGSGKSTFLKLLVGQIKADSGELISSDRVKIGYFSQHQLDEMDRTASIYSELERVASEDNRLRIRDILGAFLFSGDDVNKKIDVLSGGEKSRVALAKLFAANANTLILDEPTNHLDSQTN